MRARARGRAPRRLDRACGRAARDRTGCRRCRCRDRTHPPAPSAITEELARLVARKCGELEAGRRARPKGALDSCRQSLRHLPRTHRERQQHGSRRRAVEEGSEQLDRGRIAPVKVIQQEHERLRSRQQLEQLADGAVAAVALVRACDLVRRGVRRQAGQDGGEVAAHIVCQHSEVALARDLGRSRRARRRTPRTAGRARARRPSRRARSGRGRPRGGRARRAGGSCRCRARRPARSRPAGPQRARREASSI